MRKIFLTTFSLLLITLIVSPVYARDVVLKIRAVNPLQKAAETQIKEYLPKGATDRDIINKGNFKVAFDKGKDLYYVEQKVPLKPKEVKIFEVVLKDVWVVTAEKIGSLKKDAAMVYAVKPADPSSAKIAASLYDQINKNLDKIAARQTQNTLILIGPDKHMEEYWKDVDSLKQAETDIKMLKTLLEKKPEAPKKQEAPKKADTSKKNEKK